MSHPADLAEKPAVNLNKKAKEVRCVNVLVSMYSEQECYAVFLLEEQGVNRLDVVTYLSGIGEPIEEFKDFVLPMDRAQVSGDEEEDEGTFIEEMKPDEPQKKSKSMLDTYAVNLNKKAKEGRIDPLIGREEEVDRVVQVLCRRRKNNPLLVGKAGVGKTAIAEGLAKKIVEGQVPEVIAKATVYSLDLGGMLAGTKYRGDFERRLKSVLDELLEKKDKILFIDEIHTIIGTGSSSTSGLDAANFIKPLLSSGELHCIGSTTFSEYRSVFEKDAALARRFQKIDVEEPSIPQTILILQGLKPYFETHHQVTYTNEAIEAAVELSAKYINERFMPDKAIDVIDEAGAYKRLNKQSKAKIEVSDIEAVIAKMARIPPQSISTSDRESLRTLDRNLKMLVYGQDEAINKLVSTVRLARAGLRDGNKPWASFLFLAQLVWVKLR